MTFRRFVKKSAKNNLNVTGWMAWGNVKQNTKIIGDIVRDVQATGQAEATVGDGESFAAMLARLGISEDQLKKNMRTNLLAALFAFVLALFSFGWAVYLMFFIKMGLSAVVAVALGMLMLAYAFRSSFYYCQMKQRRLRIGFSDWLQWLMGR